MAKGKTERMKIEMGFEDAVKAILAAPPMPKARMLPKPKRKSTRKVER